MTSVIMIGISFMQTTLCSRRQFANIHGRMHVNLLTSQIGQTKQKTLGNKGTKIAWSIAGVMQECIDWPSEAAQLAMSNRHGNQWWTTPELNPIFPLGLLIKGICMLVSLDKQTGLSNTTNPGRMLWSWEAHFVEKHNLWSTICGLLPQLYCLSYCFNTCPALPCNWSILQA